ncbi:Pentatricopeptide repeat-containing protein [Thalictrum thalictroides]|uniref:Pentatricopeptide repeat-containing protein n=1 Tax=Thalictrum thalictroides TaxID=46969 RepID=A0A7J6WA92_THATH|nr:Pentatricopeptide repeat-containing protein [Thalictrum thalictroides]
MQIFCKIYEIKPIDLQIGLDLLQAIKEELKLSPSRTSLDFFLSACVSDKDPHCARLIWEEYKKAGHSYNVMTYIRMYQLHLACGERADAENVLKKISKDDPHIRCIIQACNSAFKNVKSKKKKKK